jgi:Nuclease-related domain
MPKIFGVPGAHAAHQSVKAYKRKLLTIVFITAIASFVEGIVLTILFVTRGEASAAAVAALVIGVCLWWFCRYAGRRITALERERFYLGKGAIGAREVEAELQQLSNQFFIFHNLTTGRGTFKHVVLGPTGFFALETKSWIGLVGVDQTGELMLNGQAVEQPYVKMFLHRIASLHDQLGTLAGAGDFHVRGLMIFPSAHVDAPYGSTQEVHCVRLEQLHDYIEHPVYSRKLGEGEIDRLVRVLKDIAGTGTGFPHSELVGLRPAVT